MEKTCDNCKYISLSMDEEPCRNCKTVEHNNWKPKEESAVKEVLHRGKPIPEFKEVVSTETVSHLGQMALSTLQDIWDKLGAIESFVDTPTELRGPMELGCPDNLMHNLKLINEVADKINHRLDALQEKL